MIKNPHLISTSYLNQYYEEILLLEKTYNDYLQQVSYGEAEREFKEDMVIEIM